MSIDTEITTESQTLLRTFGLTFSQPTLLPPASKQWHQFVVSFGQPLSIVTGGASWLIPPQSGLWVPAGFGCEFRNRTVLTIRMIYLPKTAPPLSQLPQDRCVAVTVNPLLRELIQKTVLIGALVETDSLHRALFELICYELERSQILSASLLEPKSSATLGFVETLREASYASSSIEAALDSSGFSRRTMERMFERETHLTLGKWVRRRRCILAAELLAEGSSASEVAYQLGYSNPSAFTEMMKRELGILPSDLTRSTLNSK